MGKKITLRETELISLIERVIKEHRLTEKKRLDSGCR